jgi:PAS domain S-box-containing protein
MNDAGQPPILEAIFEGHPAPTFIIDGDAGVRAMNRAARSMLGRASCAVPPGTPRPGDVLRCVESYGPDGCGRQERCKSCVVRNAIVRALSTGSVQRARTILRVRCDGADEDLCLLVNASPVLHGGSELVVVTLEDVGDVVRLQDEFRRAHQALRESEARFQTLASGAPVGIVLAGEEGEYLFVNEAWERMTGMTLEQARTKGWLEAIHPADRDAVAASWAESVKAGGVFRGEFRVRPPRGAEVWVQSWRAPLRREGGGVTGYVGIVVDVTDRKRAEERLRETELRLELAMKAGKIGFFDWNLEAGELRHDPRFHTWPEVPNPLRGSFEEITAALTAPEDLPRMREALRRDLDEAPSDAPRAEVSVAGSAVKPELRRRTGEGHVRWLRPMGVMIERDPGGRARRLFGTVADVTELRELQERAVRAERLASVATLVRGVCHEVNNPLGSLLPNLAYALEQISAACGGAAEAGASRARACLEEVEQVLRDSVQAADRVREIVADLKMFTSGERRGEARCDLRVAVDRALEIAARELSPCAGVEVEIPATLPLVAASCAELAHVFASLLANAGQATAGGENRVRVAARARDLEHVAVEVSDTGTGIDDAVLPRIFDPFFSTRGVGRGKGLGLSVCLGIVRGLGGDISLRSVPGAGTTATVVLPGAAPRES